MVWFRLFQRKRRTNVLDSLWMLCDAWLTSFNHVCMTNAFFESVLWNTMSCILHNWFAHKYVGISTYFNYYLQKSHYGKQNTHEEFFSSYFLTDAFVMQKWSKLITKLHMTITRSLEIQFCVFRRNSWDLIMIYIYQTMDPNPFLHFNLGAYGLF